MDIYRDPMLNVRDAATYLSLPESTLANWKRNAVVHSVQAEKRSWPTLPFVAVVEAFVLRELRHTGFTRHQIMEAAEGIRKEFGDEYGLARPGIGHDEGSEIFIRIGGELFRAKDRQQAIRSAVTGFRECITWQGQDPQRLRLAQLGNVYLDPRFGWGKPIVGPEQTPIDSIIGLWQANEPLDVIADEYDLSIAEVDRLVRAWSRNRDAIAA
jgi:uncharacterized protein (DUF433 family)